MDFRSAPVVRSGSPSPDRLIETLPSLLVAIVVGLVLAGVLEEITS